MRWKTVPFGTLYAVESRNGLTKPSSVRGTGYKMINMGELFAHDWIYDIPMELVPLSESQKKAARVEKDDLLFARQSLVLEGAGKCSIVVEAGELTVFESHLIRVRLNQAHANPMFYYYYLRSPLSPVKTIVSQCAQAGIRGSDLHRLAVLCPPIETQRRIAAVLSNYDSLIGNCRRQIGLMEEAAQRLYQAWFAALRFPGCRAAPAAGSLPEGWTQTTLGELACVLRRGISPRYDENGPYRVISQKCIRQSIVDTGNARRQAKAYPPELNLRDGDTVICSTGTGTLGRVGQVFGEYPNTTFDSHVTLVRTGAYPNFYYQAIKYQQSFLMGMGRGSTNQQELHRGVIEGLPVLVPPEEPLRRAEAVFSAMHKRITALHAQIAALAEARDRLLPKLMRGEIEV